MHRRNYRDIVGGSAMVLLGLYTGIYAALNYEMGTPSHMGPGMFPTWLGFLLAVIGAVVMIVAFFRPGERIEPDYRQFGAVMLGILVFAVTVEPFGLVPAIYALTVASVLADRRPSVLRTLVLAATLSLIAVLIFRFGLSVPLTVFNWPL